MVNKQTETLFMYGVFLALKTKNSLYFPKNLAMLDAASVFLVNQGEFRTNLHVVYEEKC